MDILENDVEVLFENTTKITSKLYYESKEKVYDKEAKAYRFITIIAAIYFFVRFAISLTNGDIIMGVINWFASAIVIFMHFKGYMISARKEMKIIKRKDEKAEDKGEMIYRFYKDHLVLSSYGSLITLDYSSITKLYSTNSTFIVKTGAGFLLIDKNKFQIGSEHDFEPFLKERNPNLSY
jgi:hypothetical protein